jgi:hypothetical protein
MRRFGGVGVVAFLLLGGWLVYGIIAHTNKSAVTIVVAPRQSVVTVDGHSVSDSRIYLSKGKHVFEARFGDFEPDKKTVVVKSSTQVILYPKPISDSAQKFLENNPTVQKEREAIAGQAATNDAQNLAQKYPYMAQLPIISSSFAIYQAAPQRSVSTVGTIALEVVALTPIDRQRAIERVREDLGIDPSSVEFIFDNVTNPFEGASANGGE